MLKEATTKKTKGGKTKDKNEAKDNASQKGKGKGKEKEKDNAKEAEDEEPEKANKRGGRGRGRPAAAGAGSLIKQHKLAEVGYVRSLLSYIGLYREQGTFLDPSCVLGLVTLFVGDLDEASQSGMTC